MSKKRVHIGVEGAEQGFARFIKAWHNAEAGEFDDTEIRLNFEDFSMLLAVLTPKRLELLRRLRRHGPMSVRALAKRLRRDYKNVHADVSALEDAGLIVRSKNDQLAAPWDVIETHMRLVA
ncbi:MAG TPA: MarR family transcriptional regulator [Gammaproteobacteria bacterium]|jgi:predicted transcriptional regulator